MSAVTITLVSLSFWLNKKTEKNKINIKKYIKETTILDKCILVIMIILVGAQTITSTCIYTENADDSFYISLATTNINSDKVYMEEPSMGYENEEYSLLGPLERITSYELSASVYSKIFRINPTIIFHTLFPLILIGISYLSYYYFARTILNKRNSKIFIIILSIILLFTAFTTKFRAGCLLYKIWQGKALFLNISLNVIIASLLKLNKSNNKSDIIILIIANLGAIHLTSTAIFIVSFVYLSFGILKLIKLKIKDIGYLIITFIPILVYVIILVILMRIYPVDANVPLDEVSVKQSITLYGSTPYLIYYLVSVVIIAFIGNKQAKKYFILIQLINVLTIWNPLFANLIAKYLTSSATYWRVFWILPIETSIAYAITERLNQEKKINMKVVIFIICIVGLIQSGKFAYDKPFAENLEKIPQYIINQTNYILEKEEDNRNITVLAPPEPWHSATMRQLDSRIKLIYSRAFYLGKLHDKEAEEIRTELNNIYYTIVPEYSVEEFNNKLLKCSVDWIIIGEWQTNLIDYIDKSIMEKETTISGYILYKIPHNTNSSN